MDPEEHQRLDKELKRLWIRYGLALIPASIASHLTNSVFSGDGTLSDKLIRGAVAAVLWGVTCVLIPFRKREN